MLELSMLPHLNAFGFHLVHIWVILGSHWVHIWVTFGARIARQACATNWASKEEMKINEFPDCRRFPKLFQRSAFRNDNPESFDLETVISLDETPIQGGSPACELGRFTHCCPTQCIE